jgi:hypothetical protein
MPITQNNINSAANGHEINRLLTAAVINKRFRALLLNDPARALATGFNGENFRLAKEERERVLAIKAQSLADFANQLTGQINPKTFRKPALLRVDSQVWLPIGAD